MKDKDIKEKLTQGWIRSIVTFEVVGRPPEHIAQALTDYLANLEKDDRIKIVTHEREDPVELEDGLYSTFAEVEVLVKDLETFTWISMNFSPASIEILEPLEMDISARDLTNWLNDLISKIHEVGTTYRAKQGEAEHLTVAMNQAIKNLILLATKHEGRTADQLEKDTGLAHGQLVPFIDHLIEKKQIGKDGELYRWLR